MTYCIFPPLILKLFSVHLEVMLSLYPILATFLSGVLTFFYVESHFYFSLHAQMTSAMAYQKSISYSYGDFTNRKKFRVFLSLSEMFKSGALTWDKKSILKWLNTLYFYFRYLSLINSRLPPKRNENVRNEHQDFHFTSAQVSIVNQMATICSSDTLTLSVDNKNKVEVGIPASCNK